MNKFWDDAFSLWGILSIPILVLMSICIWTESNTARQLQREAIHYNYGSYSKGGDFVWKVEIERDIFLKDLEFFKRNEKMFRPLGPSSDVVPLPRTEDLFN